MNLPIYSLSESEPESIGEEDQNDILETSTVELFNSTRKKKNRIKVIKQKRTSEITVRKTKVKEEKRKVVPIKRLKSGEYEQYISVMIDSHLLNLKFGVELLSALKTANVKYEVVENQKIPYTVHWLRKTVQDSEDKLEDNFVIIWLCEEVFNLLASKTLISRIRECSDLIPNTKITLIIFGLEEYFSKKKIMKNREIKASCTNQTQILDEINKRKNIPEFPNFNRFGIETAFGELQLLLNLQYKFIETGQELGLFLVQVTKAFAELPYKLEKNKRQHGVEWFAAADCKESVRVDNNGNGLLKLWQQQLCQFPYIGLDIAQAIVLSYNSPQTLLEAYEKCLTQKEGELLLQNIPVSLTQNLCLSKISLE